MRPSHGKKDRLARLSSMSAGMGIRRRSGAYERHPANLESPAAAIRGRNDRRQPSGDAVQVGKDVFFGGGHSGSLRDGRVSRAQSLDGLLDREMRARQKRRPQKRMPPV